MVTCFHRPTGKTQSGKGRLHAPATPGMLTTELIVSLAILTLAVIPLSFGFLQEAKSCRDYYREAVAMEIVDGEMEILAAGEWRAFREGQQPYAIRAEAAKNLPPGQFLLTLSNGMVRLEWRPERRGTGRPVTREWGIR